MWGGKNMSRDSHQVLKEQHPPPLLPPSPGLKVLYNVTAFINQQSKQQTWKNNSLFQVWTSLIRNEASFFKQYTREKLKQLETKCKPLVFE